ncbi:sigma-70 family RNA polymerase sigma factor [candidate division KSB1 bacterium]|nr:sigma-70 family RNA polymerase sigma factor [candidate division KSB1 bacterium]
MPAEEKRTQEDIELVTRIGNGEVPAENRLYEKYHPQVFFKVRKYLRNTDDAEDVTQEIMLKVLQHLRRKKLNSPDRLAAFIFKSCHNKVIDFWIARNRGEIITLEDLEEKSHKIEIDQVQQLIDLEKVYDAINHLPLLPDRAFLLLKYVHELTAEEIAYLFQCDSNTVRKCQQRAREKVIEILS